MKTIDELQTALGKEQQLRLIYEKTLIDLKNTLSTSPGFGSLSNGLNLDQNENIQQTSTQTRSLSADDGFCEMTTNPGSALLYNNLTASTETALGYNMRLNRQPISGNLSALLSPNHLNGIGMHFGGTAPFAQQLLASQNLANLLSASLHQGSSDVHRLTGQTSINQPPTTTGPQSNTNILYAIAETLRQIENDNAKNFPESLSTDVLVR